MSITKRALCVSPSLTLAITAKAKKMKAEGINVIGFGAGEPDFNTPDFIIDAAKDALDKGKTKYTPSSGLPELKKAICRKLKEDNGLDYLPSQIIVSNGAKHSLFNAIQAIIEEGDEVIIPAPYWLSYPELVKMSGGIPVFVDCSDIGFKINAERLEKAITAKTKLLILNSPSNPTGAVYSKEELYALAAVIEKTGIYVLSDEIYEKLVYGGAQHYSIAAYSDKLYSKTVLVNGMSKSYSMTGWRIGYLACEEKLAKAIDGMQSHATSNPNTIAQWASVAALEKGGEFIKSMQKTFDDRRRYMYERLKNMNYIDCPEPKGAFYVFVNVKGLFGRSFKGVKIENCLKLTELLLENVQVAVVPGNAFGAEDYIRLSYAVSMDEIKDGMDRIEKFISMTE